MLKTLLLCGLLLTSCSQVPLGPGVPRNEATPGIQRILALKSSIIFVETSGGQGSGVSLGRRGEWTYIGTAKHMVDDIGLGAQLKVHWFQNGRRQAEAFVVMIHPDQDVAVIRTTAEIPGAEVSTEARLFFTPVVSYGSLMGVFPPVAKIGFLVNGHPGMLSFNAGIWFGDSGGALVDFETGHVIGILVHVHGDTVGPLSHAGCAVPIAEVLKLFKDM